MDGTIAVRMAYEFESQCTVKQLRLVEVSTAEYNQIAEDGACTHWLIPCWRDSRKCIATSDTNYFTN